MVPQLRFDDEVWLAYVGEVLAHRVAPNGLGGYDVGNSVQKTDE